MTDKEKTRQQLIDSMRKTKASVNDQVKTNAQKEVQNGEGKQNARNIQSERPKTKPKPKTTSTVSSNVKSKPKVSIDSSNQDPYQSGRRVWPD